jgi:hypothetical protein
VGRGGALSTTEAANFGGKVQASRTERIGGVCDERVENVLHGVTALLDAAQCTATVACAAGRGVCDKGVENVLHAVRAVSVAIG